jgi:hypothetical protein
MGILLYLYVFGPSWVVTFRFVYFAQPFAYACEVLVFDFDPGGIKMGTIIFAIHAVRMHQHSSFKRLRHVWHVYGDNILVLVLMDGLHDDDVLLMVKRYNLSGQMIMGHSRRDHRDLAEYGKNNDAKIHVVSVFHYIPLQWGNHCQTIRCASLGHGASADG